MKNVDKLSNMVNPSTDMLLTKLDSRYGLVVLSAKRARQLMAGDSLRVQKVSNKNVTNAMKEIYDGKISYDIFKNRIN